MGSAAAWCQLARSGASRTGSPRLALQPCLKEAVGTSSLCQPLTVTRHAGADCLGDFCCPVPSRSRGSIAPQWGGQAEGQAAGGPPKPHFLGKNPNIFSLLKLLKLFPQVLVTGPLTLTPDRALRALIGLNSPDQPHLGASTHIHGSWSIFKLFSGPSLHA